MKFLASLPLLAIFSFTTSAHAVLLVHEQFLTSDYTVDVTVENQNGGTGFDTAWTKVAGLASHVDYQPRTSGLSYSNLNIAGGSLEHFRNSGSPDEKRVIHSFDALTPITVSGSTQMYIGFLFEVSSGADFMWIYAGDSNRDSSLTIDATGNASFTGAGNSGTTIPLGPIQSGTNMFLLRATDATSGSPNNAFYDELEVWLNPDLQNLGTADGSGYGIISKFNGGDTDMMPDEYILGGSLDPGESFKFDELFVTDDLSTVVIPEPGAFAMLAGGLGLLAFRRRRTA